jgi:hypothetical protein
VYEFNTVFGQINYVHTLLRAYAFFAKLLFWSAESRKEASPWSTANRENPDAGKVVASG